MCEVGRAGVTSTPLNVSSRVFVFSGKIVPRLSVPDFIVRSSSLEEQRLPGRATGAAVVLFSVFDEISCPWVGARLSCACTPVFLLVLGAEQNVVRYACRSVWGCW